jgi:hypothetical protein
MAVVRCDFYPDSAYRINYAFRGQMPGDPADGLNVSAEQEDAIAAFKAVREIHNNRKSGAQVFEIWQSWHPDESKKLSRQEVNQMGRELAESMFKEGHQVLIVTHSSEKHLHNHILVNPVNYVTGKRLNDKLELIPKLREMNDQICLKRGLSIPNKAAKERRERTPEKVKQMERFRGHSYVLDMIEKGNFAAKYATNFDEYQSILGNFGIDLRVGKTLSYHYPDKGKPKRDRYMPKELRRSELENKFKENTEAFRKYPELRSQFSSEAARLRNSHGESLKKVADPKLLQEVRSHERALKTENGLKNPAEKELKSSLLPLDEIRKASQSSIIEYCKRNNIYLIANQKGQTVLKGREYVRISENEWTNGKNKTQGTLIEFASAYHHCTFIQAIAKINNNPRLLLLEQYFGEKERKYYSFHVPKERQMDRKNSLERVGRFLRGFGVRPEYGRSLLDKEKLQVSNEGHLRFLPMGEPTGAVDFIERPDGKWTRSKQGAITSPFLSVKGTEKRSLVFLDPFSAMKRHGQDLFSTRNRPTGILVLLEPNQREVDIFVAQNPKLKELVFVHSASKENHKGELDFFNVLKARYASFGISMQITTPERAFTRGGPELSL